MLDYDVIIVGAGPAGLMAATYLGRFRRKTLVLDGGRSRANWIPESHNTPGFPRGVSGPDLLADMDQQAALYGAERRAGKVIDLQRTPEGFAVTLDDQTAFSARFVLLATGVVDRLPPIDGIDQAIHAARVRMCPICDAYEAIDMRIAVLGDGDLGAREAAFLTTYSAEVTLLHLGQASALSQPDLLADHGVTVQTLALDDLEVGADTVRLRRPQSEDQTFDCLYLALGCEMQSGLAVGCGAAHDPDGNLIVNAHQETTVSGLYAAGDVVRGLNQIAVAAAEAAIAASNIHQQLRRKPG